jgi:hypothetical protein
MYSLQIYIVVIVDNKTKQRNNSEKKLILMEPFKVMKLLVRPIFWIMKKMKTKIKPENTGVEFINAGFANL